MHSPVIVLKFGSSVLRGPESVRDAVHEVYRHVRHGRRVIAVVSAFEGATQALLRAAHLKYHLTTAELLTPEQNRRYAELRGYTARP